MLHRITKQRAWEYLEEMGKKPAMAYFKELSLTD
jgi:hypothetical protein